MKEVGTRRLETGRLILRRFTVGDAEDMYRGWASDPEVTRYLTWPCHVSSDATAQLLAAWAEKYTEGDYFNWAIESKETGAVIGNISVVKLDETVDSAEIGYCLGRAFWGRGIMPEALRAVMDYMFDEAEVNRLAAYHDVNNPNSGRVMQKAGMLYEGTHRQAGRNNQGICDMACYAILRSDRKTI
ncbi:MAG: GNAT family N-acetyltransferase [Oscillospiraceae bacterium]|nr:GNAT family N-acetyltransferase [Oscillospiraceae bacterium]